MTNIPLETHVPLGITKVYPVFRGELKGNTLCNSALQVICRTKDRAEEYCDNLNQSENRDNSGKIYAFTEWGIL